MITEETYLRATEEINKVHSLDVQQEQENGRSYPAELLYSKRMLELLDWVNPDSSYALKIAAQCQHFKRWGIPRADFPYDRRGYHQWRRAVMEYQLQETRVLLTEAGLDESDILLVLDILKNQGNKSNSDAQIIEDTACLVFLKWYMESFAAKHEHEKVLDILKKTMRKMSEQSLHLTSKLDLPESVQHFLTQAIS